MEAALDGALPGVEQILVFPLPSLNSLVALAVPLDLAHGGNAAREAACQRAAAAALAAAGLEPYTAPTAVALLSERWTPEAGTLTSSMKVDRSGIKRRFAAELARLGGGVSFERLSAFLAEADDARAGDVLPELADMPPSARLADFGFDSIVISRLSDGAFKGHGMDAAAIAASPLSQLRLHLLGRAGAHDGPSFAAALSSYQDYHMFVLS